MPMDTQETFIILTYALIGISGALSIIVFVWGFATYISRLGTDRRIAGIRIMEWGVGLVTASIVLIGILHLLQ